jgi:hypothetical protein
MQKELDKAKSSGAGRVAIENREKALREAEREIEEASIII